MNLMLGAESGEAVRCSAWLDRLGESLAFVSLVVGVIAIIIWWLIVAYGVVLFLNKSTIWLMKWLRPAK